MRPFSVMRDFLQDSDRIDQNNSLPQGEKRGAPTRILVQAPVTMKSQSSQLPISARSDSGTAGRAGEHVQRVALSLTSSLSSMMVRSPFLPTCIERERHLWTGGGRTKMAAGVFLPAPIIAWSLASALAAGLGLVGSGAAMLLRLRDESCGEVWTHRAGEWLYDEEARARKIEPPMVRCRRSGAVSLTLTSAPRDFSKSTGFYTASPPAPRRAPLHRSPRTRRPGF